MGNGIYRDIARALADGLPSIEPKQIHIPARRDAAGAYAPSLPCPAPDAFPALYGASLVAHAERRGDWLYVTLTDAFYDALVSEIIKRFPRPVSDNGSLVVNRLRVLSNMGGTGCPPDPAVQRALLLAAGAEKGAGAYRSAACAALCMLHALPPAEREALRRSAGPVAGAIMRLLAAAAVPATK